MLNDVKYKSSLTLTLETPKLESQNSIAECYDDVDDDDNTIVQSNLCEMSQTTDETRSFIMINSNKLSNMNRTFNRSESYNELSSPSAVSSCSNGTIIPIKYLIHDERTDCSQINIGKFAEISPKYCCTLEVKFVW